MTYASYFKSHSKGTDEGPFGTCPASTADGHTFAKFPNVDFNNPDQYSPAMGPSSQSLSTYPLPDAVSYAKANSAGLRQYLGSHPDAFVIDSYVKRPARRTTG